MMHAAFTWALVNNIARKGKSTVIKQLLGIGMGQQDAPSLAQTFASVAEYKKLVNCSYATYIAGCRYFDDVFLFHLYTTDSKRHPNLPTLKEAQHNINDFMNTTYPKPCRVVPGVQQIGFCDKLFLGCKVISKDCKSFHLYLDSKNMAAHVEQTCEKTHPTQKLYNTIKSWSSFTRTFSDKVNSIKGSIHRAFQFVSHPSLCICGLTNVISELSLAQVPLKVTLAQISKIAARYQDALPFVRSFIDFIHNN